MEIERATPVVAQLAVHLKHLDQIVCWGKKALHTIHSSHENCTIHTWSDVYCGTWQYMVWYMTIHGVVHPPLLLCGSLCITASGFLQLQKENWFYFLSKPNGHEFGIPRQN